MLSAFSLGVAGFVCGSVVLDLEQMLELGCEGSHSGLLKPILFYISSLLGWSLTADKSVSSGIQSLIQSHPQGGF